MITSAFDPASDPDFHALLRHVFGAQVVVRGITILQQRSDYVVLFVRLKRPRLRIAIKLAGPTAPDRAAFGRTAALHALLRQQKRLPVPPIIATSGNDRRWPWRWSIKPYLPGVTWARVRPWLHGAALHGAYTELGAAVAALHSVRFGAFGCLDEQGRVQPAPTLLAALQQRAEQRIAAPHLRALFSTVLHEHASLFAAPLTPTLVHDDLHHYNVLFAQQRGRWHLQVVLDFDSAWAGPAESDLARLELWMGMTGAGFWPAYQTSQAVAPDYAARRPIYQLLWCLEYAAPTPKHLADTARVCQELGLPPLATFS